METEVLQGTETLQVEGQPATGNPPAETSEKVQEFTDPGQLEGMRNEPNKQHEPPVGSKRWSQIYWENKEKERKIAELENALAEKNKVLPEKAIPEPIQTTIPVVSPQQVSTLATYDPLNTIAGIDANIAQLRDKKAKAHEEMNYGEVSRCEDIISDLKERRVYLVSSSIAEQKSVDNFINGVEWLSPNNPKYDPVMAGAARYLDDEMMKTFKGNLQDRLNEVKKTVEKRFGYGNAEPQKLPLQNQGRTGISGSNFIPPTVEGVMSNLSNNTQNIKLTPEQQSVARKMFPNIPDAEKLYAKNL